MDLNHRSTGYEPVGLTKLTYPAVIPTATVSILEPTDPILVRNNGRFLDRYRLGLIDEGEFPSNGCNSNFTQR